MKRIERLMNATIGWLVRRGIPVGGAAWMEVRGRRTGQWRGVVVNPLRFEERIYLVAPRGETLWVKNLRATTTARLAGEEWQAIEVPVDERDPIHAAYLGRWASQVRRWFTSESDPADHPTFELVARPDERLPERLRADQVGSGSRGRA